MVSGIFLSSIGETNGNSDWAMGDDRFTRSDRDLVS
jgi:hypothetical protein